MSVADTQRSQERNAAVTRAPVVFVTIALTQPEIDAIKAAAPTATVRYFGDQTVETFEAAVAEAHVLLGRGDRNTISATALKRASELRWIHTWAAGPNDLLSPELVESAVVVTASTGSGAIGMSEHALNLMLTLASGSLEWIRAQREHKWVRRQHGELNGLTCGIIGLGNTGQDLAEKLKACHMKVLGIRRSQRPAANVDAIFTHDRLHEFLGLSDFVVVTAPLTNETRDMLGEREFRAMKKSAYYICSSRGAVANEAALLRALNEGWIAGAGLDAFASEPLPADSPFWDLPNTIVTPHDGANTPRRRRASLEMFAANLRRYVAGESLEHVVDKHAGY